VITLRSLSKAMAYSLTRRRADEIAAEQARAERAEQQERVRLEAEKAAQALRAPMRTRDAARGRRWLVAHHEAVSAGEEAARLLAQRELAERQAREAEEAAQRKCQRDEWLAELERRRIAELDPDGSLAEARKARDEQLEQERLDFLAAQLVRRTA
jgi:hypothetical protein